MRNQSKCDSQQMQERTRTRKPGKEQPGINPNDHGLARSSLNRQCLRHQMTTLERSNEVIVGKKIALHLNYHMTKKNTSDEQPC